MKDLNPEQVSIFFTKAQRHNKTNEINAIYNYLVANKDTFARVFDSVKQLTAIACTNYQEKTVLGILEILKNNIEVLSELKNYRPKKYPKKTMSAANIASILGGSSISNLKKQIDALLTITKPMEDQGNIHDCKLDYFLSFGFDIDNIASMLNGSNFRLAENIDALSTLGMPMIINGEQIKKVDGTSHTKLSYLLSAFTPSNISSILNGSRCHLKENIETLFTLGMPIEGTSHTKLSYLLSLGFTSTNIASMLHASHNNLAKNIEILLTFGMPIEGTSHTKLSYLQFHGFTPSSISSMLNGCGDSLSESIEALFIFTMPMIINGEQIKKVDGTPHTKLSYLESNDGFHDSNPTRISNILNGSGNRLAENIEVLLKLVTIPKNDNSGFRTHLSHLWSQGLRKAKLLAAGKKLLKSIDPSWQPIVQNERPIVIQRKRKKVQAPDKAVLELQGSDSSENTDENSFDAILVSMLQNKRERQSFDGAPIALLQTTTSSENHARRWMSLFPDAAIAAANYSTSTSTHQGSYQSSEQFELLPVTSQPEKKFQDDIHVDVAGLLFSPDEENEDYYLDFYSRPSP